MACEEMVYVDAAEGESQLFEVETRERMNSSMKDHQEYNLWIQNFAPGILSMVLEQLNVYKNVGEGGSVHR